MDSVIAVGSLLLMVQSMIFIFSSGKSESIIADYGHAWVKTFRLAGCFLVGSKGPGRKDAILAWVFLLLCIPGFFLVRHALMGMQVLN